MTNPLSGSIAGEVTADTTRPFWIVEIGFASPLRFCNRQPMTVDGDVFEHVGLDVSESDGVIYLVNEENQFTDIFYDSETDGVRVKVWAGYGNSDTWSYDQLSLRSNGDMGAVGIGSVIQIRTKRDKPRETPGLVIGDVVPENHLIPDGAIANTSSGKVKLTHT